MLSAWSRITRTTALKEKSLLRLFIGNKKQTNVPSVGASRPARKPSFLMTV